MKLICLNTWGGKVYEPLIKFVREQSRNGADIFCFQEVFRSPRKDIEASRGTRVHLLDELAAILPNFNYVFHPILSNQDEEGPVDFEVEIGQAEFVKKSFPIISSGDVEIFSLKEQEVAERKEKREFEPRNFGYIRTNINGKKFTIINVHGLTSWKGEDKLDNPERLEQSRVIKEFALKEKNPVIICGDFNILPQAESIKTFGSNFEDLVKKYRIERTRSKLSKWYGLSDEMKFSDYVFVSPDVRVYDFSVPEDVAVSDHLPLILEFN